ncbi:hypothetical protein [Halobacillus litoralis]|nr:hypothetical protein [Halobacillus litoralis]
MTAFPLLLFIPSYHETAEREEERNWMKEYRTKEADYMYHSNDRV